MAKSSKLANKRRLGLFWCLCVLLGGFALYNLRDQLVSRGRTVNPVVAVAFLTLVVVPLVTVMIRHARELNRYGRVIGALGAAYAELAAASLLRVNVLVYEAFLGSWPVPAQTFIDWSTKWGSFVSLCLCLPTVLTAVLTYWLLGYSDSQRRDGVLRCLGCGYMLKALSLPRCPECGRGI